MAVTYELIMVVGVIMADTKGSKQRFEFFKGVICPFAKHRSQESVGGMVYGVPTPALVGVAPYIRPLLIALSFQPDLQVTVTTQLRQSGVGWHEASRLF